MNMNQLENKAGYTVVRRLCICLPKKEVTDAPTNGPTDRRTDGPTHPLIESWLTTKKLFSSPSEEIVPISIHRQRCVYHAGSMVQTTYLFYDTVMFTLNETAS